MKQLGMGSALETLCGQAFGAGRVDMLGIYMQRSWVILNTTALLLMFVYIFAREILLSIGQAPSISTAVGTFAIWMIPQLFAYSVNFPISKFLQAQSKIMVMAVIAAAGEVPKLLGFYVELSKEITNVVDWRNVVDINGEGDGGGDRGGAASGV